MYKQATQKTGEVLSLPPKWLGMYSDFITKNSSAVSQIESALRSLTYIIPGMLARPSSFSGMELIHQVDFESRKSRPNHVGFLERAFEYIT